MVVRSADKTTLVFFPSAMAKSFFTSGFWCSAALCVNESLLLDAIMEGRDFCSDQSCLSNARLTWVAQAER